MKKRVLIIALIIVVVLAGAIIFIFRERPLIPEGYTIQSVSGSVIYEDTVSIAWKQVKH